ncbi:aminopeptidase P family protein, partial [Arthrobacter deserti]|nr:aminopeptidase P family protein [Arthrobacter deserti]
MSTEHNQDSNSEVQPLGDRVNNRSQRPESRAFKDFMGSSWAPADTAPVPRAEVAGYAARPRLAISRKFPGERLVVPAGPLKVRSNDTDYRFRPHSGFAHLTGLGLDHEPDAVLDMEPVDPGTGDSGGKHRATLYFRPPSGRESPEFYANARYGEFWIGPRPTLAGLQQQLDLPTAELEELE